MKSINFINGYGKVNPIEDEEASRLPSKTSTTHTIFLFLSSSLALIVTCTIVFGFIHGWTTESPASGQSLAIKTTESIRTVCSVTRYPDSCCASMSLSFLNNNASQPNSDPELMFTLSLRFAADELRNLSSLPNRLISESNDPGTVSALRDCVSLFDDALSQLNKSVASVGVGPGEKLLTEEKIGDLSTWISAAMTDQETCLDGLQEMGSTVLDEVRRKVQKSKEYMSNSLSILVNIHSLLIKFGLTMH